MKTKLIYFLCDANERTGMGHFLRCIALARAIMQTNIKVVFIGDYSVTAQGFAKYFAVDLQLNKASIAQRAQQLQQVSAIIIDSYYFEPISLPTRHHYVLIDDFCQHLAYPVQGVLNFTLAAINYDYVIKGAKNQALGLKYYLAHPAISELKLVEQVTNIKKILIMIGSGDVDKLGIRIADLLYGIDLNLQIKIVGQPPAGRTLPYTFIAATPKVDHLYRWADFCITSGGLAKYECAFLGRPAAVVSLTKAELAETLQFSHAGLCYNLGASSDFCQQRLREQLTQLLKLKSQRLAASAASAQVFSEGSAANAAAFALACFKG
jgi:UDP-2,4-diacetamido-2,4,6-trideoxy-beta-L-altropyranose hydrolase